MRPHQRLLLPCLILLVCALLPAAASAEPVNTTPPSVTGDAAVGATLTATPGAWTGVDQMDTYWVICETDTFSPDPDNCPEPATSDASTFEVPPEAAGKYVIYLEYAQDEGGDNAFGPSNAIGPITDAAHPFGLTWDDAPNWWIAAGSDSMFVVSADHEDIDDLSLTCKLDQNPSYACNSSSLFSSLAEGTHTFTVTATDGTDSETLSHTWTVGAAAAHIDTEETPGKYTDDNEAQFYFDLSSDLDDAHAECRLDGGDWGECPEFDGPGSAYYEDLSDGEHTFSVRGVATDPDDSESTLTQDPPDSYTWTVDTREPVITNNLPDVLGSDSFNVEFTTNEPLRYMDCQVDDDDWEPCLGGLQMSGLADGEHSLYVEAEDRAGNEFYDSYYFYVDAGATIAIFTQKPPHYTTAHDVTLAWTASSPGATFECRMNEPFWHPCTSPTTLTGLVDGGDEGSYDFYVRATKDGRTQAVPTNAHWHVVDSALGLYWDEYPDAITTSTYADFDVDVDNADSDTLDFTCTLDGGTPYACDDSIELEDLELGSHTLTVSGTDGTTTEQISYTWQVVDSSVLDLAWDWTPSDVDSSSTTSFGWRAIGRTATETQCKLDNAEWARCDAGVDNPSSINLADLADGEHTFSVRQYDALIPGWGNTLTKTWTVDTTPPVISLNGATTPTVTSLPAKLDLSSSEPLDYSECLFAGSDTDPDDEPGEDHWYPCSVDKLASYLPNGAQQVQIRGWDGAGNMSNSLVVNFNVNVVPPVAPPPAAPAAKTSVQRPKMVGKHVKFKTPWLCAESSCTISAKLTNGKSSIKFRSKKVNRGYGPVTFKLTKRYRNWIKRHAGKGKKVSFQVTITSALGSSTASYAFKP